MDVPKSPWLKGGNHDCFSLFAFYHVCIFHRWYCLERVLCNHGQLLRAIITRERWCSWTAINSLKNDSSTSLFCLGFVKFVSPVILMPNAVAFQRRGFLRPLQKLCYVAFSPYKFNHSIFKSQYWYKNSWLLRNTKIGILIAGIHPFCPGAAPG